MHEGNGYVVGRECQGCNEEGHDHSIAYLLEDHPRLSKKRKIFQTKAEAIDYIEEVLDMSREEVMIIPVEEILDDE